MFQKEKQTICYDTLFSSGASLFSWSSLGSFSTLTGVHLSYIKLMGHDLERHTLGLGIWMNIILFIVDSYCWLFCWRRYFGLYFQQFILLNQWWLNKWLICAKKRMVKIFGFLTVIRKELRRSRTASKPPGEWGSICRLPEQVNEQCSSATHAEELRINLTHTPVKKTVCKNAMCSISYYSGTYPLYPCVLRSGCLANAEA